MMNTKSLIARWVTGGLLTMICATGCITHPPGGPSYTTADGKFEYDSHDLSTGAPGINPENYHYHWSLLTADGTRYDYDEYYISHSSDEEAKDPDYRPWYHPRQHGRRSLRVGDAGTTEDYGWYTCITHPPGWIECGVQTQITHPPGIMAADKSK